MGNNFGSEATLRWQRLADRQTDLFVATEFIAPDVLFKTMNSGYQKNRLSCQVPQQRVSGGPYLLI